MRKFFTFFSLALVMLFTSCSGLSEKTGSISFTFSGDQLEKIISKASASRAILKDEISEEQETDISGTTSGSDDDSKEETDYSELEEKIIDSKVVISVELSGDYNKTKSSSFSVKKNSDGTFDADDPDTSSESFFSSGTYTLSFDSLPVGAKIKAVAKVKTEYTYLINGKSEVSSITVMKGSSDIFTVNAGPNSLDIEMKFVPESSEEEIVINYTIEFYISDDADAELSEFTKYGESITGSYSASKPEDGKTQMDTAFQTVCDKLYSERYIKKETVEANIDEHNLVHKHYFVKNPNIGFNVEFEEIQSDTVTESINLEYDEYTGSFTAASGFDSYEWYIEENGETVNVTVAAANANTFTPVLDDLSSGIHYVTVVVTKNGESYSSSKPFTVTKE